MGLAGEEIPRGARIFAVADTFDAITTDRPYRRAAPPQAAVAEIRRCSGTQFDPVVVDAFEQLWPKLWELRQGLTVVAA
jgi:HD-GYP domain-containing protein (c-di-GMP phosphodiesterase class II)